MPRLSTAAFAAWLCAIVLWQSAVLAQDLGSRTRRPMERGPVDVAQLTQRADLIVHGSVTSKEARWIGRVIYTHYDIVVQETFKGAARTNVSLRWSAGRSGTSRCRCPAPPTLRSANNSSSSVFHVMTA